VARDREDGECGAASGGGAGGTTSGKAIGVSSNFTGASIEKAWSRE